ncbi:MAG: TIGR00341 family protein [Candidatus Limnocylindrales bacterium]
MLERVADLVHGSQPLPADLEALEAKLLFDRPPVRDRLVRFFVLLFLATVIAAGGLMGNSSAVIIGAMIVAPLMTPMMAASLATLTGDGPNIVRSVVIVTIGVAFVMVVAGLMALLVPAGSRITPEVLARTSPHLLDLIIALAAGAAGAFAIGRTDVSDALPGVAIAVSLVPPLAASSILLVAGEPAAAGGAFLLFFTNFVAIVAAGVVVLALMGYGSLARRLASRAARRTASLVILIALLLIIVPLGITSYHVLINDQLQGQASTALSFWLAGTSYEVQSVSADDGHVDAYVAGEGAPPPMSALLADLQNEGVQATIAVHIQPEQTLNGSTDP